MLECSTLSQLVKDKAFKVYASISSASNLVPNHCLYKRCLICPRIFVYEKSCFKDKINLSDLVKMGFTLKAIQAGPDEPWGSDSLSVAFDLTITLYSLLNCIHSWSRIQRPRSAYALAKAD